MKRQRGWMLLLRQAPLVLFVVVFAIFGCLSDRFLHAQNLINIMIQSSSIAIAAVGMTLVLLTAGVDLSVGSVMFLAVAVAGKLIVEDVSIWMALAAALGVGAVVGAINGVLITRMKVIAFIATLGMLFIVRGFGLWLTNTRAMNMPASITELGASRWLGIPVPVLTMLSVVLAAHLFLTRTIWGRQIYAIGSDPVAAVKAGIRVDLLLFLVYVTCGLCAALGGWVALTQTGAVSPSFGQQREFSAIAAAVLGGTSLFGGRGNILPGAIFGAVLFQTIENGLVIMNADPYLYPMILSSIIFVAVLLDTTRWRLVRRWGRRQIRGIHDAEA